MQNTRSVLCGRLLVAALAVLCVFPVLALATANPRLEWKTLKTEHFDVHFHAGAEWTAQEVARIAEEIYAPITGIYNYEPERCHFVILDTEDYANGSAYYYDNKIEIWATNLEFNLRGTTRWLQNVVTHEFTHIVSIQAAMKMPLRIPAIYFQLVDFEDEKRPDVITGYPDIITSYPITGTVVPAWWAEGVAQYMAPGTQYDCWDSHRDMIVRSAFVDGRLRSYDEMGYLGHNSLGNEQSYDHGFSLVRYIAATYGPASLDSISERLGKPYRLTIDGALKDVTGKKGNDLYADWKASLKVRYDRMLAPVHANPRSGTSICDDGFMTISPSFSPDGKQVAFLCNEDSDFSSTDLYLAKPDGSGMKRLDGPVSSRGVFSPDGKLIAYAKHVRADIYGAMLSDLYVYDIAAGKERRVTENARVSEPQWTPDGKTLVCILNRDGTHRLARVAAGGGTPEVLYSAEPGNQMYAPQVSPDGARVLFGIFTGGTRDIASVGIDGSDFRTELKTGSDERDARFTPDGKAIVFASDRNGIFNLFRMDIATRAIVQLTNVVGGAFMPDAAADGSVVYSEYTSEGYGVSMLGAGGELESLDETSYATRTAGEFDECRALKTDHAAAGRYEDGVQLAMAPAPQTETASDATPVASALTPPAAEAYKWDYTRLQLYPRVVVWDGTPRLGLFASSNEIMDRQSLFFGGSYGVDGEFDAIVDFELRRLFPVIFMEYYRVRQKYDDEFPIEELGRYYYVDYRYDVWSADMGLRFEFEDPYSLTRRNDVSVWWNHSEYSIHLDPAFTEIGVPDATPVPDQEVGWRYFVGNEAHARWYYKAITRARDSDINPRGGREFTLDVMYAHDNLFTSGDFSYGVNPDLTENNFGQYTLDYKEYLPLPGWRHTLQLRLFGSVIDRNVDDFFWVYMGGMDRLRGYTYYAIGGRKGALASLTYRFPIWSKINTQMSWITFKDLYGAVFFEAASAWNHGATPVDNDVDENPLSDKDYYSSVGGELRLAMGSFYSYPTTLNVSAAYAMDQAQYANPIFDVPVVTYDRQVRWYMMLGFNF